MLFQVTATGFTHRCALCGKEQQAQHTALERITDTGPVVLKFTSCAEHAPHDAEGHCGSDYGCMVHIECFHPLLSAAEETSPTRDAASREQVRNVRLLYQYNGLPVKP